MKRIWLLIGSILAVIAPAGAANDAYFPQQWALKTMHVESAWRASRGDGVVVAVVDTGVDLGHPDLADRIVPGRDFVDGDSSPQDENGHGTHMAGSIAAVEGNGIGIAGVAPDARIMPVRVLDENGRTDDPTIVGDGIRWAVDNGAKVINLSLAADGPGSPVGGQDLLATAPIDLAIRDAVSRGAVVIIAAGNNDAGGEPSTSYDATVEGALVVGATTKSDKRAAYSNYGKGLDVVAPGGGSATDPDFRTGCTSDPGNAIVGLYWNPQSKKSDYAGACGTSVAVAQVSGIAALLLERGMTNVGATQRIEDTAVDLGTPGRDDQTGYGRVDAARAVGVTTVRPSGRTTAKPSPTSKAGVGAAATTPASATPEATQSPTPPPVSERTPEAASERALSKIDRSTPIAVAAALVFFAAWAFFVVIAKRKERPA